ncbi:MAG: polysaccharide deacetylase family protein [Candidatus Omnitrophica bacterium]|nr:polysaccharide deacetylase family protein [Candidatus Omnitrophota bacterium]
MRKQRKLAILLLLALLIAVPAGLLRSHYVVPILMYHSVSPQATKANRLSVSAESFERQMRFLKTHDYNVLPLEEVARLIAAKKKIPPRTVAITFDDGYRDNYEWAFPVLKKYGLPATIFVIVDEVGRPQQDRVSWEELRQMQDSGVFRIGSHCMGPEPLVKISSPDEVRRQIFASRAALEERLGKKVLTFSYPEGRFNEDIRRLVIDAGYQAAVATNPGRQYPDNDIFALKRLRISHTSDNLFVFWIEASGYYTFMKERRHK